MRGTNPNGRNKFEHPHVRLYHWEIDSAAFRDLSAMAVCALIVISRFHNGSNNGEIIMSVSMLADRLRCSRNTAHSKLKELQEHGFIVPTRVGCFAQKNRLASTWRLTGRECNGKKATKEFMGWKPKKNPGSKN
ncbi:MAG: helix-turn-helix domain-containing protein [Azospirillaceae bacterium]